MTYQQTMDYLYSHLPMFSRVGAAAYKEDLHNTIALCNAIGNPESKFKSVHIAGTNGKGSTSHMLAAILQQAGYKTGLYTSPHLRDFRERIRVNGEMVEEGFITRFVEETMQLSREIQPSFFELTVAMAFEYFAQQRVDIAVIETGLGGRLDSTNIITPLLSIITNIGYDHINILGETIEKIAFEKAGIIKPGVPVVVGEYTSETIKIFRQKAAEGASPIYFVQNEYEVADIHFTSTRLNCTVKNILLDTTENYSLDLNGLYQVKNLLTVLAAVSLLGKQGFVIEQENRSHALANVKKLTGLHGRWEVIGERPLVVLDVAHNEDGIRAVLEQAAYYRQPIDDDSLKNSLHIVIGLVRDKDLPKVLSILPGDAVYYFTNAHIPRALPARELMTMAMEHGLTGKIFDDVNEALRSARENAGPAGLVLVCGSVFLIGEVTS